MTARRVLLGLAGVSLLASSCAEAQQSSVTHGSGMMMPATVHRSRTKQPTSSGGTISLFADPVLTMTSTTGTNPPLWDSVMSDLQQGDILQLDFTSNGAAPDGNPEESHTVDSFDENITWATFTGFAGGATVKWRERYGRTINSIAVWSNWSNTLSDVMTAAWAPSSLFASSEYGFALDATDSTKRFTDSACTTAANDTDPVGCLKDIAASGTVRNFVQTGSTARPILSSTGGYHVEFDATNDYLTFAGAGCYAAGTCTIIMAVKNATTAQTTRYIFDEGRSAGTSIYTPCSAVGSTAQGRLCLITNDAGSNLANTNGGTLHYDGTWEVITIKDSGTVLSLQKNRGTAATVSYTRSGSVSVNQSAIGARLTSSANSFGAFYVGRIIVIGRTLNSTEQANAEAWAAAPYSITLP